MAREFLRITPEATWGTYDAGGTHTILHLDQNNAFTMRAKPVRWSLNSAGFNNRRAVTGSSKTAVAGNLNTLVYGTQASALTTWCAATGSPLNIPSCTVDHCIQSENAASDLVYRRYLGTLVQQVDFTATEKDQFMRANFQLVAKQHQQITATDFPEPAATAYPTDPPYTLPMASGFLILNDGVNAPTTTGRSGFESFSCTIKNMVDTRFFESQFLQAYRWCGRTVDWKAKFKYAYIFDRTNYEAITAIASTVLFNNGPGDIGVITVTAGGTGYVAPKATVAGATSGTGAVLEVIQVGGIITEILTVAPGFNYAGALTVTISDSVGSGATATAAISANNHTLKFDFKGKNYFDDVADDLALDKIYLQQVSMQNYLDASVSTDFAFTVT